MTATHCKKSYEAEAMYDWTREKHKLTHWKVPVITG